MHSCSTWEWSLTLEDLTSFNLRAPFSSSPTICLTSFHNETTGRAFLFAAEPSGNHIINIYIYIYIFFSENEMQKLPFLLKLSLRESQYLSKLLLLLLFLNIVQPWIRPMTKAMVKSGSPSYHSRPLVDALTEPHVLLSITSAMLPRRESCCSVYWNELQTELHVCCQLANLSKKPHCCAQ